MTTPCGTRHLAMSLICPRGRRQQPAPSDPEALWAQSEARCNTASHQGLAGHLVRPSDPAPCRRPLSCGTSLVKQSSAATLLCCLTTPSPTAKVYPGPEPSASAQRRGAGTDRGSGRRRLPARQVATGASASPQIAQSSCSQQRLQADAPS